MIEGLFVLFVEIFMNFNFPDDFTGDTVSLVYNDCTLSYERIGWNKDSSWISNSTLQGTELLTLVNEDRSPLLGFNWSDVIGIMFWKGRTILKIKKSRVH